MSPPASYLTVQEFLLRQGVDQSAARNVSIGELRHWDIKDLAAIFGQIERKPRDFCPFKHVDEFVRRQRKAERPQASSVQIRGTTIIETEPISEFFHDIWPSVFDRQDSWISPSHELMVLSAKEGSGALCVNSRGEWAIRKAGYAALSHVWIEGLQRDGEYNGVSRKKINLIFQTLQSRKVDATWLWIDVLAIPGSSKGQPDSSSMDESLKTSIINTLPDIYKNADTVIVFDALAWHLKSSDPVSVAVILVCGLWSSRLWTLQEVKMASKVLIITGGLQPVTWGSIQSKLAELEAHDRDRYHYLWLWFAVAGNNGDEVGVTPVDLARAAYLRRTGNSVDYARAFFPILGLEWRQGMTREQGMQEIFYSHQYDSSRLIFMFGCPRLAIRPAWAPCDLTNLRGVVGQHMQIEARGIRGKLLQVKLVECADTLIRFGKRSIWFTTINGDKLQCQLAQDERPTMLNELQESLRNDFLHLLLPIKRNVPEGPELARPALLVEKSTTISDDALNDGFECAVFCCVMIQSPGPVVAEALDMLIRHNSPSDYSGFARYVKRMVKSRIPNFGDTEATPLHFATLANDPEALERLLDENDAQCDSLGSNGLSALHIAAQMGSVQLVALLIARGAYVNLHSLPEAGRETPLMLAVKGDHVPVIFQLGKAGADMEAVNEDGETALMIAARDCKVAAARKLMSMGAQVNRQQGLYQESPLFITCAYTQPREDRLSMAGYLLQAGANVNKVHRAKGSTPLHQAVQWANEDVVSVLIAWDANVDAREYHSNWTPLKYAVEKGRRAVVEMLVENGAACDTVFQGQWSLLHFAALCHDSAVTKLLLNKLAKHSALLDLQLEQDGRTALHMAAQNGNIKVSKLLLQAGANADIELPSSDGAAQVPQAGRKAEFDELFAQYKDKQKTSHD